MINIDTKRMEQIAKELEAQSYIKIEKAYNKAMKLFISIARITLTQEQQRYLTQDAFRKRILIGDQQLWFGQNIVGVEKFANARQSGDEIVFGNNQRVKRAFFMQPKHNKTPLVFQRKNKNLYHRALAVADNTVLDKKTSKQTIKHINKLLNIHFYPKFQEFLEKEYAK